MTWSDVVALARRLPDVEESTWYRTPALKVADRGFARLHTEDEGELVLMCSPEGKEALLASGDPALHTSPHYDGYGAILVDLGCIDRQRLAELLEESWRLKAPAWLSREWDAAGRATASQREPDAGPRLHWRAVTTPMIAPSILSADFAHLADEAEAVAGADWLHVDVMDGHFVPNLTLGLPVVESLLGVTDIPLDCHLMIENPDRWAPRYAEAGAHNVTFHAEATDNPVMVARDIRAAGGKAGLSVKPGTPIDPYLEILKEFDTLLVMSVEPGFGGQAFIPDVLGKARAVRRLVDSGELRLLVEIDGGINADTIEAAAEAGVDCFVAGSAVYGAADPSAVVRELRAQAARASAHLSIVY